MIASSTLEYWLTRTVAFANLPRPINAAAAVHELCTIAERGDVLGRHRDRWPAPERGYAALHREWCRFLAAIVVRHAHERLAVRKRLPRLRRQCIGWSMSDATGRDLIEFQSASMVPFEFDERGAPQLGHVAPTGPEGMLAIVGAELLNPNAAHEIWRCKRCERFHWRRTLGRGRGHPRKYCEEHDALSTPNVQKHRRKEKLKKRNRHA